MCQSLRRLVQPCRHHCQSCTQSHPLAWFDMRMLCALHKGTMHSLRWCSAGAGLRMHACMHQSCLHMPVRPSISVSSARICFITASLACLLLHVHNRSRCGVCWLFAHMLRLVVRLTPLLMRFVMLLRMRTGNFGPDPGRRLDARERHPLPRRPLAPRPLPSRTTHRSSHVAHLHGRLGRQGHPLLHLLPGTCLNSLSCQYRWQHHHWHCSSQHQPVTRPLSPAYPAQNVRLPCWMRGSLNAPHSSTQFRNSYRALALLFRSSVAVFQPCAMCWSSVVNRCTTWLNLC